MAGAMNRGTKESMPKRGIYPGGKYVDGAVPPPAQTQSEPSIGGFVKSMYQQAVNRVAGVPVDTTPAANGAPAAPVPANPVVTAVTENTGLTGQAVDALRRGNAANQEALNFADGSASVPGPAGIDKVRGVSLTKGESVLPADTTAVVGPDNIARLIAATHTPVGIGQVRAGVHRGGKYANGSVPPSITPTGTVNPLTGAISGEEQIKRPEESAPAKPALFDTGRQISQFQENLLNSAYGRGVLPSAPPAQAATSAPTTPATQPESTAPPAVAPVTTAPQPKGFGARPAPLPVFGQEGGYVRNDQTGATYLMKGAPSTSAPSTAPTAPPANDMQSRMDALVAGMRARGEGTSDAARIQLAAQILGSEAGATHAEAQTDLTKQESAKLQQMQALQQEMAQPDITDKRKAQIAEILHGMRGSGDLWMPVQEKDAMGMPTGMTTLVNRATGETKPMTPTGGGAAAGGPVEGSRSTSGGKPIVFKNGKWEFA